MGEGVTQRAEAVAIEFGADKLAVGKNEGGGAVPGFTLLRKGSQGRADVARKQGIFFKGRRNHSEHGFFGRQTFEEAELEGVVGTGGMGDVFLEEWTPRRTRRARWEFGGLGAQTAVLRDDGVDLTVVGDVAEGLCEMPGGLGVS